MTSYNSNTLQQDADALSLLASEQITGYAAAGAVFAWVAVFFLEPVIRALLHLPPTYSLIPLQIVAALVAAILGGVWGYGKALTLKLQAQAALCQMKIEQNTSHLEEIKQTANWLEKIEREISQLEERASVAPFTH